MKINVTFNLTKEDRAEIASYYGGDGLADYATCRTFIESMVQADIESLTPTSWDDLESE